jgi:hypothetical protein
MASRARSGSSSSETKELSERVAAEPQEAAQRFQRGIGDEVGADIFQKRVGMLVEHIHRGRETGQRDRVIIGVHRLEPVFGQARDAAHLLPDGRAAVGDDEALQGAVDHAVHRISILHTDDVRARRTSHLGHDRAG